jgi:large subunit ribosomal protein L9
MEVILKEDVVKLGSRGDVVKVAAGYGRNYLLPKKLAIEANAANKAVVVQMKASAVRRNAKEKAGAEELAKQIDAVAVSFTRKAGEGDHLFGSVTSSDIAAELTKKGFDIDRRKIQLHEPLKQLGDFTIAVKLHREVTAHFKVVIEKEAVAE